MWIKLKENSMLKQHIKDYYSDTYTLASAYGTVIGTNIIRV